MKSLKDLGKLKLIDIELIVVNKVSYTIEPFAYSEIKEVMDRITEENTLSFRDNIILDFENLKDFIDYEVINFFNPFTSDYDTLGMDINKYMGMIKDIKRYNVLFDITNTYISMWNNVYNLIVLNNEIDSSDMDKFNNSCPFDTTLNEQLESIEKSIVLSVGEMGNILSNWGFENLKDFSFNGYLLTDCIEVFKGEI